MPSFNKVLLMGNMTRDPQLKYLQTQTPVAEFGLACNRKFRTAQGEDREEVVFVDCAAFGKQAETINQYCAKGKPIFIEGRLKYDAWDEKATGAKRSKLTIVVENFQLLGYKDDAGPRTFDGHVADGVEGRKERWHTPTGEKTERAAKSRPVRQQPAEAGLPFGEEKKFAEADIPF